MRIQTSVIHNAIHETGGLLDQAHEAQAKGQLGDFFAQLIQNLGPVLGALMQALLAGLLKPAPK